MKLKKINVDEMNKIFSQMEIKNNKKVKGLMTVKLEKETYSLLMKMKKANNLKSVSSLIDMLIITTGLSQFTGDSLPIVSIEKKIIYDS